jgi:hypothetical protein
MISVIAFASEAPAESGGADLGLAGFFGSSVEACQENYEFGTLRPIYAETFEHIFSTKEVGVHLKPPLRVVLAHHDQRSSKL